MFYNKYATDYNSDVNNIFKLLLLYKLVTYK